MTHRLRAVFDHSRFSLYLWWRNTKSCIHLFLGQTCQPIKKTTILIIITTMWSTPVLLKPRFPNMPLVPSIVTTEEEIRNDFGQTLTPL